VRKVHDRGSQHERASARAESHRGGWLVLKRRGNDRKCDGPAVNEESLPAVPGRLGRSRRLLLQRGLRLRALGDADDRYEPCNRAMQTPAARRCP